MTKRLIASILACSRLGISNEKQLEILKSRNLSEISSEEVEAGIKVNEADERLAVEFLSDVDKLSLSPDISWYIIKGALVKSVGTSCVLATIQSELDKEAV